ncbi:Calcineurin-binding protein cabin-1 [Bulinus truncatus]|nr:Calcineurin-binding protein cabin-1 [Bulinus truncatus]
MLRISALNDQSNSKDDQINIQLTKTKEAKEAEAFVAYNKALSYQHRGNSLHAERLLRNLFDHPLLKDMTLSYKKITVACSFCTPFTRIWLLYYCREISTQKLMTAYIEAVKIDSSEVTVWFQMGQVARKLDKYPLVKICFQQALQCNPNHWPSLDNAITLNYALGDYIFFALEKDCNYTKALALKSQIYSEQPSLKDITRELFHFCNATVNTAIVDHNETQEYIDEALQIRSRRRQIADEAKEKELGSLTFLKPLIPFSWKNLGEQLIDLYDFVTSSHPPKSLALEVDFRDYFFLDQAVFLRQFEKQTKQLDVISNNKECIIEPTLHKTQQETPLINLGVNVSNSHTTVINTKETALLKRLHGILDVEGPVIKKKNTDLILDKEDGFKDLEPVDISGTFELPLLREEDMDIDTLNLADIPKSSLKSDDDIAPQDLRSLENVLASVIEMEFQVQKEHNIEHMMKSATNPIEAEVTNQDVQCSFFTSTERATSLKGNDFLEIQQFQQQKIKTDESKMVLLSGNKTTSVVNESDSLQISAAHNESDLTIKHSLTQKPLLNFPSVLCSKPDSHTSPQQNTDSVNFNITDPAKTNTYNEFFMPTTLQQSFDILSENCLELEFLDGLKSTTDTVIERKTKVDSQPKIILTPSGINVCPAELAHSPITTSLFSPDISCPKSAFVYHSVLSSIKQNELIGTDKNEYYSPIKSFKTNCSKSSNRKEQPHLDSLIHGNNSLPNERKLCDTIENLTQNQLLLENIDERSKISLAFTGQMSPSSQLNDSLMNSSISLGQNSVTSAPYFLRHESSSLSSHFLQAGTFSDGVNNSASLSLPSHHLNMLTALESEILLKSSKDHNNTDVTEWPNARLTGRHSSTKPQSLYQLSYFPKYQPKHHSHLLLSTSVRSPLLSKGYQLPFEASGSVIYPSISPPKMFPGSALIPCSHLYLDDFSSAINTNFLLSSTLSPNPSQFLNNTTSHFNSTKTSFNNSVYHETIPPNSAFKISPGKADQCHQHSPKSQSLSHSQHHDLKSHPKYPQFASVQPQYLEPQSPSSSSTITSHQDHNYQKKGLLCQEKKESSDSATLVSTQVLPPKLLESLTANEIRTPIDHVSKSSGVKRGPKRKIEDSSLLEWTNAYKRRSTRSRSIKNQKEGKTINYKNLMKSYIPSSLLNVNSELNFENDDVLTVDIDKVDSEQDINLYKLSVKKLNENEETDVKTFIKNSLKSNGVIDLIYKYLLHLANKFDVVWYEGIVEIYLKLYKRLRNHLSVPTLFDDIELLPADGLKNYAAIILVSSELNLNQAVIKFDLKNVSPSKAAHHSHSLLKLGDFHSDDMAFLASLIGRNDALGSWLGHFSVRYYWMKAKEHHLLGQTLDAVDCYEIALEFLQDMETVCRRKDVGAIVLPNIQDCKISSIEAKRLLEALQRSKSLEDNQKLYDEGHYDLVIENLVSAFNKRKIPKSLLELERPSQLLLLINSLYHSHKHVEGIKWAEVSVDEAVLCYKRVPSIQLHQEWAATLVALFSCIDRLLEENCSILSSLSRNCLCRLANNLTSIIDITLDVADTVTEMPIPSLLPWKIFYRVLHYEELCYMKAHVNDYKETNEDDVFEEEMSRSLTMLTEAHEYLGRHSWCTKDNGLLLLYTISVLAKDLDDKEIEDIHFEQCVYCLYGHPTKKGKARSFFHKQT